MCLLDSCWIVFWCVTYFSLLHIWSASHTVGCEFASQLGHTKDHHKNGTNCLPALHTSVRVRVWQCSPPVWPGNVWLLNNLLGSIARVGYHIPVVDFYLVLHGLRSEKALQWINHNLHLWKNIPYFPVYKPMGCINRKSFSLQFFLHFACIPCITPPPPSETDTRVI